MKERSKLVRVKKKAKKFDLSERLGRAGKENEEMKQDEQKIVKRRKVKEGRVDQAEVVDVTNLNPKFVI